MHPSFWSAQKMYVQYFYISFSVITNLTIIQKKQEHIYIHLSIHLWMLASMQLLKRVLITDVSFWDLSSVFSFMLGASFKPVRVTCSIFSPYAKIIPLADALCARHPFLERIVRRPQRMSRHNVLFGLISSWCLDDVKKRKAH